MAAWLKRHIHGRTSHIVTAACRVVQGLHLCMRLPGRLRETRANNLMIFDNHASDPWIRRRNEKAFCRPLQGEFYALQIVMNFHVAL